ncbi:MAG: beta-ketoacyl-[acyl-carrier-protein] synthase family protein [Desulfobulbaceae bacterium]|jgi:3-oxoacyl-[acyl-carrier-protein] synthase II|nr:beta-ketoacyl-[acyl-carrier-protein] synthase family protein [Desulfobulbaceae bacterium]
MTPSFHISISGMGIITPAGSGVEPFSDQLFAGLHQFKQITGFDTSSHRTDVGAEIPACDYKPRRLDHDLLARTDLFGLEAAFQALTEAGLLGDDGTCLDPDMGIVCGTAGGAISGLETFFSNRFHRKECRPRPLLTSFCLSALGTNLAQEFAISGPRTTMATVCSSSGLALARGFDLLLHDEGVNHVLVVSAESLSEVTHGGFNGLRSIAPDLCRPFDQQRKGLILGEAGCAMVLSRVGPPKYGFLAGYGLTTDLYHFTAPDPEGTPIATAITKALHSAGLTPVDVDYINCHGTATLKNDAAEARGIGRVFGSNRVPVSSTKSMFGHTLGSASLLEAIASLLGMQRSMAPPTANVTCLDALDLDVIVDEPRPCPMGTVLSNSFAFGGSDICLVLTRDESTPHGFNQKLNKAVITGIGVVSPLGVGCAAFASGVAGGGSGLQSMTQFSPEFSMEGGLVDMAAVLAHIPLQRRRRLNRLGSFLTVAVEEALEGAGLTEHVSDFGMVYGSAFGCSSNVHKFYTQLLRDGAAAASPQEFMFSVTNAPVALVAQHLQIPGEVWVLVQDEVSWEAALHLGATLIETGKEKRVIVAAADEVSESILAIHAALGFFAGDYVLGEGCVAMVLEDEEAAAQRSARALGRVESYSMVQDCSCGPMDFCRDPSYQKQLQTRLGLMGRDDDFSASFRSRVGDSGVGGGLSLAAQLLTSIEEDVFTCTSSRGGILAGTLVSRKP